MENLEQGTKPREHLRCRISPKETKVFTFSEQEKGKEVRGLWKTSLKI